METKTTIASLSRNITTEAEAYSYIESLRWGDSPTCGHCESTNVYLIGCANGVSRKTRTGNMSERRVWKCRDCKRQFSVLTNTVMHGTKVPVRCWVLIYFEMAASKNGTAAREIERKYGFCPRTAWYVLHRLRAAMGNGISELFAGNVIADETYIGGSVENRHAHERVDAKRGRGTKQTPVVTIIDADKGVARSEVTKGADAYTLGQVIRRSADITTATLHSDSLRGYQTIGSKMAGHFTVNHSNGEYVNEKSLGTNKVEGFFSQLKRSLDGTHHSVTPEHLQRYVSEFDFRYSTRKMKDVDRMALMVEQSGRRLTYRGIKTAA